MNSKNIFVVIGTAALCGLALAQTPKSLSPVERLDALEKAVQALQAQVKAAPPVQSDEVSALKKEVAETRVLVNQLLTWGATQADGAVELARVLDESEQKGFTFGINPDSRVALLNGWRNFATGMQKDAPKPIAAAESKGKKGAKGVQVPAPVER